MSTETVPGHKKEWKRALNTEILFGLKSVMTEVENVGDFICKKFISGESDRLVIIGPPGAGKTTVLSQLREQLLLYGREISVVWMDWILNSTKSELEKDPPDWDEREWDLFSLNLLNEFKTTRKEHLFKSHVIGLECVGLGNRFNRGRSTVETISKKSFPRTRSAPYPYPIFLAVIPHKEAQLRASTMRAEMINSSPIKALEILNRNGITIENQNQLDPLWVGRTIREIVSRQAPYGRIEVLNNELDEAAAQIHPNDRHYLSQFITQSIYEYNPEHLLHALHLFRVKLRIPVRRGFVVINPYNPLAQIHWSLEFLLQHKV